MLVEQTQTELTEKLNEKYEYVILKGIASATYYPRPELRCLGDVDFLTKEENVLEIEKEIVALGYENYLDNGRHITFKKTGKMIELHREITGVPYGEKVKG